MARRKLSANLWKYRKQHGLTQSELAFLVNCPHRTAVAKHECGEATPGLETLLCYELLFGVCTHDLYASHVQAIRIDLAKRVRIMVDRVQRQPAGAVRDRKILSLSRFLQDEDERANL